MDIWELNGAEIERLQRELTHAHETGRRVRVAWDGGLKVKVGEGMWTPPLGETTERRVRRAVECRYCERYGKACGRPH